VKEVSIEDRLLRILLRDGRVFRSDRRGVFQTALSGIASAVLLLGMLSPSAALRAATGRSSSEVLLRQRNARFSPLRAAGENRSGEKKGVQAADRRKEGKRTELSSRWGFAGIPYTESIPPDCSVAAGGGKILTAVNSALSVYHADGTLLLEADLSDWFSAAAPPASPIQPQVAYDFHAGRWIVLAVAFDPEREKSSYLVSVSETDDPLGEW